MLIVIDLVVISIVYGISSLLDGIMGSLIMCMVLLGDSFRIRPRVRPLSYSCVMCDHVL